MLVTFLLGNGHSTESAQAWRQASSESEPLPACSGVRLGSAPRAPATFPPGAGAGPPQPHPRVLPASGTHHFHRCPEGQCGTQTFVPGASARPARQTLLRVGRCFFSACLVLTQKPHSAPNWV